MAKKKKVAKNAAEEQKNEPVAPVAETPVPETPVKPAQPFVVNCHQCGAALRVTDANVVYMCPVCKSLMRVRIGEKLVMDVSRQIVAESYVNVVKDNDLN